MKLTIKNEEIQALNKSPFLEYWHFNIKLYDINI